jgi:hypothetical protein
MVKVMMQRRLQLLVLVGICGDDMAQKSAARRPKKGRLVGYREEWTSHCSLG